MMMDVTEISTPIDELLRNVNKYYKLNIDSMCEVVHTPDKGVEYYLFIIHIAYIYTWVGVSRCDISSVKASA